MQDGWGYCASSPASMRVRHSRWPGSLAGKDRRTLRRKRSDALGHIGRARPLLLNPRLELELLLDATVQPRVELPLGARVRARRAVREAPHEVFGLQHQ